MLRRLSVGIAGTVLVASLALYAVLGLAFIVVARESIGPDGIAYLRIAGYYLEGNLDLAVASHWGPLLSWLLVPWLAFGANGILAIKVINLIGGGLVLIGVHRLRISVGLTGPLSTAVQIGAALLVSPWVIASSPDVLLAGLLTLYFAESYRACMSPSVAAVVRLGLLGGLAALAKPYGLPFFAAHFTVMLLLFGHEAWKVRATRWLAGMTCFAVVLAPRILLVANDSDLGGLLASGSRAHAWVAPGVRTSDDLPHKWLVRPREGRITSWENPAEIPFPWPTWSPFDSRRHFVHQINVIVDNLRATSDHLYRADLLGLLYIAALAAPALALLPGWARSDNRRFVWRWALPGLAIYMGGYIATLASADRYLWPIEGLLLVLAGCLLREFCRLWTRHGSPAVAHRPQLAAALVLVLSLAATFGLRARAVLVYPDESGRETFEIAAALTGKGIDGPLAANQWVKGLCVSYRLGLPFAGMPPPADERPVLGQLRAVGARSFLLFKGAARADDFARQFQQAGLAPPLEIRCAGQAVDVYDLDVAKDGGHATTVPY